MLERIKRLFSGADAHTTSIKGITFQTGAHTQVFITSLTIKGITFQTGAHTQVFITSLTNAGGSPRTLQPRRQPH